MNETRIIITLDPEDRARLDRWIDQVAKLADVASGVGLAACTYLRETLPVVLTAAPQAPQDAPREPEKQEPTEKPTESPAPAEKPQAVITEPIQPKNPDAEMKPTADRKTVKRAAVAKIQAGHRDEVKAIIADYGVEKLDAVPEEKLPELLERLEAL